MQRHLSILAKRIFPPVPTSIADDFTLLRVRRLQAQVPLLYFTMLVIIAAAAMASSGYVPWAISHVFTGLAGTICATRMFVWMGRQKDRFRVEAASKMLFQVSVFSTGVAVISAGWCLLAWTYAPLGMAIYFPVFLALGTMATTYSLATMRSAALAVLAIGLLPISLLLLMRGDRADMALATSLLVTGLFLARMLLQHHDHLVTLLDLQLRMKTLAETDPLTGLSNRRALMDDLREEIRRAAKTHSADSVGPAVAMIDLDGFKPVNDCHGHAAGDAVLQQVALRFDTACRDGAKIYRLGGDEFALLIPAGSDLRAEAITDGVMASLARPFKVDGAAIPIGASLGMAIWPGDGHDAEGLIALADSRLYLAKADHHRDAAYMHMRDEVTWAVA